MAVVGEAKITVIADTSRVKEQIRKGFHGATAEAQKASEEVSRTFNSGLNKSLGDSSNAFKKLNKESENLARSFAKSVRRSYVFQAGIGALIQSVAALGGGLLALAGNLAGAGSAGIALVGIMAQLKVASLVGKQAFSGVMAAVKAGGTAASGTSKTVRELKEEMQQLAFAAEGAALGEEKAAINLEKARENLARVQNLPPDNRARREAELAYQEADLAYRKAKDRNADLQEEIANPKKKGGAGGAANDPYKDLTKTQKAFAQYLVSVQPRMKELKEAAASSFLPVLTEQMQEMFRGGFFDMLVNGFEEVSKGLGKATAGFAGTLFDPQTKGNLAEFFKNSSTTVGTLGGTLGKAFGGFLSLMRAIQPLISRFTLFLDSKADAFGANMQGNFANIMQFFKDAGDAAAGWGAILGRLFEKFKGMIKANVGPGTGGQLLLDFFNQGTTGFRGLDGAAGEFARKQHFLAAATNLKAMLESLSKIFGFMTDLGTDPGIATFFSTLSELETPLQEIFASIQGSSDELATLLVTIVEIIASFADAAQLETYLGVLSNILKGIAGFVRTISPLMQAVGPLVGAFGALVTIMLLTKKVSMIVYGTARILGGGFAYVTRMVKGLILANKMHIAQETLSMRIKRAMIMLTTAEGRAKFVAGLKTIFTAGASQKAAQASAQDAIAKAAQTGATVAQGVAATAATGPTIAFAAAVNSAIWPLTLIVLAIAAVIAVVIALVSWFNQIKADNVKKANKALDKSFTETKGKIIGATDAQNQWTASLLSVNDAQKTGITDVKQMGAALNGVAYQYGSSGKTITLYTSATYRAREVMDVYLGSLSKLAKKNLPEAQRQFRNMVVSSGMNRKATELAVTSNKSYVAALEKQAKAMGDTIMKADGTVDALKAVDYAIGEGSYVRRKAVIEQQKFAETFKNAAKSFIDTNDAIQKATDDKGKFSLTAYIKNLGEQSEAVKKWRQNISKLNTLFKDKAALQGIVAQGAAGAGLVDSLANPKIGSATQAVKDYTAAQKGAADATKEANLYAAAYADTAAVENLILAKVKSQGTYAAQAVKEAIASGAGAFELAERYGITEAALLKEQARLQGGADLASKVNITAAWADGNLEEVRDELVKTVNGKGLELKVVPKPKDGGAFKNGGLIARFANGWGPSYNGRVSGLGTARSDQIPAMISNGEYVVNARATAQNLELLNAINGNRNVSGMGSGMSIVVNAAPGMDEQQVASLVAYQLRTEMRKGATI
jgi:hypothetical protein